MPDSSQTMLSDILTIRMKYLIENECESLFRTLKILNLIKLNPADAQRTPEHFLINHENFIIDFFIDFFVSGPSGKVTVRFFFTPLSL